MEEFLFFLVIHSFSAYWTLPSRWFVFLSKKVQFFVWLVIHERDNTLEIGFWKSCLIWLGHFVPFFVGRWRKALIIFFGAIILFGLLEIPFLDAWLISFIKKKMEFHGVERFWVYNSDFFARAFMHLSVVFTQNHICVKRNIVLLTSIHFSFLLTFLLFSEHGMNFYNNMHRNISYYDHLSVYLSC